MRTLYQESPRRTALIIQTLAGILLCAQALAPSLVQANNAPLDTLGTPSTKVLSTNSSGPLSRSRLPEAKATTVPKSQAPSRPPRLDDPMDAQLSYSRARMAAQAGDPLGVNMNLKAALEASPSQPNIFLWQGIHALKSLDTGTFFKAMPSFLGAMNHSPLAQGQLLINLQQISVLATAFFWSILLLSLYVANWRYLSHDWTAILLRNRSHPSLGFLPLLLPLVILMFKPGWLGYLAMASVPILIRCRTRGRWLLLSTWLVALVIVFPWWPILRNAVPTIDPTSEVTILDRAATFPSSALLIKNLKTRLGEAKDPARKVRLFTALGIQEARAGYYSSSTKRFDSALMIDPECQPAQVGKGNNLYYQGKLGAAMRIYQQAVNTHPKCGEAHYNLAQVYFRKLFVPEATTELETSRRLGYNPNTKSTQTEHKGYAPVVYPGFTHKSYIAASRAEAGNYPPQITLAGWLPLLGVSSVPLYSLIGIPLMLAILIIMGRGADTGPRECENCGIPLCRTCRKVRDGANMCAQCGEIAQRAQSDMILATLLKNRSRTEGMASTQRIVRWGHLLPGTGHLAGGKLLAAWLRLSLVAGGLFLVTAGWAFQPNPSATTCALQLPVEMVSPTWIPLPLGMWHGWTALPVLLGLAVLVLAWLIALTDGRRLHKVVSERYSLIPVATNHDNGPQYSTEVR